MSESNAVVKRVQLSDELTGRERIKVMLAAKGQTPTTFARLHGFLDTQVFMAISNSRPYPAIRDALAAFLERPRSVIDALIEGAPAEAAESRTPDPESVRE